jgi:hypothetical protein
MFLFAQTAPEGLSDVLILPGLCMIIGLGLWYGGLHYENRTEKSWLKWCAFIPLAIGIAIGIPMFMQSMDYTYQQLLPNKKVLYGHYAAFGLPLAGAIAVIVWHLYLKKSGAYEHRI